MGKFAKGVLVLQFWGEQDVDDLQRFERGDLFQWTIIRLFISVPPHDYFLGPSIICLLSVAAEAGLYRTRDFIWGGLLPLGLVGKQKFYRERIHRRR